MAPLHHHFEKKGWAETQVVVRFWIITMLLCLVGPGQPEAAMNFCVDLPCSCSAWVNPAWRWRAGAPATARACGVGLARRAAARRRAAPTAAGRCTLPARRTGRAPTLAEVPAGAQEPRPGAARPAHRAAAAGRRRARHPGDGRAGPVHARAGRPAGDYAPQLLAITGTNGKTTTTAMTALLVERAGRRVAMAGNIGPTMLDTLAALDGRARRLARRSGCWSCRASSSTASRASSPTPPRCSTSPRTTSTGTARWPPTPPPRRASSAPQAVMVINRDDPAVEAMVPAPVIPRGRGKHR
jgi:hypothetical protein